MSTIKSVVYTTACKDAVWESLPIIMARVSDGLILHINKSAAQVFGYDAGELLDQPVEVLVPEKLRAVHAIWRRDNEVPNHRQMAVSRHMTGVKKDGTTVPVHVGLMTMVCMGEIIGIALVVDLTAVLQAITDTTSVILKQSPELVELPRASGTVTTTTTTTTPAAQNISEPRSDHAQASQHAEVVDDTRSQ